MANKRTHSDPHEKENQASGEEGRIVRGIEFSPEQWEAISTCAFAEGHQVGPWVRAAALEKAQRMGVWKPFEVPGPKKS